MEEIYLARQRMQYANAEKKMDKRLEGTATIYT
jgi:hypothetical protein